MTAPLMEKHPTAEPVLSVRDLRVTFDGPNGPVRAVDGVSLDLRPGEVLAVVGESGSGKSVTAMTLLGLTRGQASAIDGEVRFGGRDLLALSDRELRPIRGAEIAMVFQDPMTSLNPTKTVGRQIVDVLRLHTGASKREARERAVALLEEVGIPQPQRRVDAYPHEFSGGMRQRAMIAMAIACEPKVLIADEPTTALDVTIQAQVLELLKELVNDLGTAMVMITHDLGVVAGLCDFVNVMYAGRIVESAPRRELFAHPRHRYTEGLLKSIPRLDSPRGEPLTPIPGTPRDVISWSQACAFAPRCPHAADDCVVSDLSLMPMGRGGHQVRCVHPAEERPTTRPETRQSGGLR